MNVQNNAYSSVKAFSCVLILLLANRMLWADEPSAVPPVETLRVAIAEARLPEKNSNDLISAASLRPEAARNALEFARDVLLQTGRFDVINWYGVNPDFSDGDLLSAAALNNGFDFILFLRLEDTENNGLSFHLGVFNAETGTIAQLVSPEPFDQADMTLAGEHLVAAALEQIAGTHIGIGSIQPRNTGVPGDYDVYLDAKKIPADRLRCILAGTYDVEVRRNNGDGETVLMRDTQFLVEDGLESVLEFCIPDPVIAFSPSALDSPRLPPLTDYVAKAENGTFPFWSERWKLKGTARDVVYFTADAHDNLDIALSSQDKIANPWYNICIGGWNNTKSVLWRNPATGTSAETGNSITKSPNAYWLLVDRAAKIISVGSGTVPGKKVLLSYTDPEFIKDIMYFSFSSWNTKVTFSGIIIGSMSE